VKPDPARDATYHRAPEGLRERILQSVEKAPAPHGHGALARYIPLLAACFALVAIASWNLALWSVTPHGEGAIAQQVVDAHVRSLMTPGRLRDVESSDSHTVKPWFAGRIDFAPPVRDLAEIGFPLTGGRIDHVNGRAVAALTYSRRLHVVSLFVWPAEGAADEAPSIATVKGFSVAHWTQRSMRYWAITDAAPAEVETFARALGAS
jgi:anti-sigma factor RsiW